MYQFKFSDIGEGLHEGTVAEVYKKVGDTVKEGDSLFSVETDKMTSDIPSPVDGVIAEVLLDVGKVIHVGDVVYVINTGKGAPAPAPAAPAAPAPAPKVEEAPKSAVVEAAPAAPVASQAAASSYTGPVEKEYDLIVIGAGPGGYLAAEEASKFGFKTLIVEKEF